jgi:ribose/xylose/arabinose/galactoside ABC-type transport system permease subunit
MLKKDLGLFLLIVIVGAVVAFLNPRFISPINLANTANLVGLFGLFSSTFRSVHSSPCSASSSSTCS